MLSSTVAAIATAIPPAPANVGYSPNSTIESTMGMTAPMRVSEEETVAPFTRTLSCSRANVVMKSAPVTSPSHHTRGATSATASPDRTAESAESTVAAR